MSEFDKKFNGQIEVIENRPAKVLIIITVIVGILVSANKFYYEVYHPVYLDKGYNETYALITEKIKSGQYEEAREAIDYMKSNYDTWYSGTEKIIAEKTKLGQYEEAKEIIDNMFDSLYAPESIRESMYTIAEKLMEKGEYSEAAEMFRTYLYYYNSYTEQYDDAGNQYYIFESPTEIYEKIHECEYKAACELMDAGQYRKAIAKFEELEDYNDSKEKIDECKAILKENSKSIDEASVGDIVFFGNYEGEEEWIVLRKEGHRCLLLSLNIIACRPFGGKTWETSTMRTWLNDTYLNTAFSEKEKNAIIEKDIITLDNEECGTEGGDDTADKVFLLSVYEANAYLPSIPEEYLESSYEVDEGDYAGRIVDSWWLRSPGFEDNWFYCETGTGSACEVNATDHYGVRPAIWVNASKL